MTNLTRETIEQPFGPGYRVYEAATRFGPASPGYVVESVSTGKFVWTGGYMSIREAFDRLIKIDTPIHAER